MVRKTPAGLEYAMPPETPFRIGLVVMFALSMSIGIYYRLQASATGKKISYREEGYLFATLLRLSGFVLWLLTATYLIAPSALQACRLQIPDQIRYGAIVAGSLCSLLMWWTLSSLGKNLTDTVVTRSAATLVTSGPYQWVRHPFYVTAALLMTSATLITANWAIGIASVLVLALLAIRTPREEQKLIDRFGQQYRDYMAATWRYFPRISFRR